MAVGCALRTTSPAKGLGAHGAPYENGSASALPFQLAAHHAGVFRRGQLVELAGHPVQPARAEGLALLQQVPGFELGTRGMLLVVLAAAHA